MKNPRHQSPERKRRVVAVGSKQSFSGDPQGSAGELRNADFGLRIADCGMKTRAGSASDRSIRPHTCCAAEAALARRASVDSVTSWAILLLGNSVRICSPMAMAFSQRLSVTAPRN